MMRKYNYMRLLSTSGTLRLLFSAAHYTFCRSPDPLDGLETEEHVSTRAVLYNVPSLQWLNENICKWFTGLLKTTESWLSIEEWCMTNYCISQIFCTLHKE